MPIDARRIALATFIPLGVIAMIAVYVAVPRGSATELSKQTHFVGGSDATVLIYFATAKGIFHLWTYPKEKLPSRR
jgi:hypothetical protein